MRLSVSLQAYFTQQGYEWRHILEHALMQERLASSKSNPISALLAESTPYPTAAGQEVEMVDQDLQVCVDLISTSSALHCFQILYKVLPLT